MMPEGPSSSLGTEVLAHLRQLEAKGSPGLAARLAGVFLRDTGARLEVLRDAVARQDAHAIGRVAHTLQGSAAMVGALILASRCAELRDTASHGSFDRCDRLIAELQTGLDEIRRVMDA